MKNYNNWNMYHWNPKNALWRVLIGFIWFAILSLMLSACESFTEVDLPNNQLTSQSVFEEKNTAHAAMTEVYAKMRDQGMLSGSSAGLSLSLGLYADELDYYGTLTNGPATYYNNVLLGSTPEVSALWMNAYKQIYGANAVIEGVTQAVNLSQADRDQLKGEALFARALLHFYLTNLFDGIPYVTTTDYTVNTSIQKIPQAEVYNKIKADLEEASELLGETYLNPNRTRPNKFAVLALHARVDLYAGNWAEAANNASAVLNSTLYDYLDPVQNMFLTNSRAVIWQFSPNSNGGNTREALTFNFTAGPPPIAALTQELIGAFETGDLRLINWTRTITNGTNSWSHPYKYKQTTETGSPVERSQVLRLAEVILIRAEARARQGELTNATEDLNLVRAKAGLAPSTAATQQEILDAILQERRYELFAEFGHRFFDLKRFGMIEQTLSPIKEGWDDFEVLFPLPESEINLNPNIAPQNFGY